MGIAILLFLLFGGAPIVFGLVMIIVGFARIKLEMENKEFISVTLAQAFIVVGFVFIIIGIAILSWSGVMKFF